MALKNVFAASVLATGILVSTGAIANTYGFSNITNNGNQDLSKQLSMTVTEVGNQALFTIDNKAGGFDSSIAGVYFDQGIKNFFAPTTTFFQTTTSQLVGSCTSNCSNPNSWTWTAPQTISTTNNPSGKTGSSSVTTESDKANRTVTVTTSTTTGTGVHKVTTYKTTTTTYSGSCTSNCTNLGSNNWTWTPTGSSSGTSGSGKNGTVTAYSNTSFTEKKVVTDTEKKISSGITFSSANSSGGVKFADGGDPSNLPGGNNVDFNAQDWSNALPSAPKNGVNPGEYIGFLGTFIHGNYSDLLKAIGQRDFRVGLHVISIDSEGEGANCKRSGGSDSYVNAVPLPAAGWLFGSALMGFMGFSNRRKV